MAIVDNSSMFRRSARRKSHKRKASNRVALIAACFIGFHQGSYSFVQNSTNSLNRSRSPVRRHAEDEADPKKSVMSAIENTFKIQKETLVEKGSDFHYPMEGLFNFFNRMSAPQEDKSFVDSSLASNYVTVLLDKPMGIALGENEGTGALVAQIQPGSNAEKNGAVEPGYQLIVVNDVPVISKSTEEITEFVSSQPGPMKLTFFKGPAEYFYGKLGPSTTWLSNFLEELKTKTPDVER